jgi:thioredoxin reductase (NADPH)
MQKRALNHDKIVVYWNTGVEEFIGDTMLTALRLKDLTTGEQSEIGVGGAFETIGHIPNTGVFKNQIELDNDGYIKLTNPNASDTSVDGLFAAGDVHDKVYKQAVTAAGCGCRAAIDAERWLQENRLV